MIQKKNGRNGKATRNTTSPAGISVFNALMFMIQKKKWPNVSFGQI